MLIQIERSGRYPESSHGGALRSTDQKPTLIQALGGGLKNLLCHRPLLAIFQANLRCNSNCGYCNLPLNKGRYEMTRKEIQTVFRGLYHDGLRLVFVQGGEPLLRRDLPDILEDLVQIGFRATLITNGTRLTADLVRRFETLSIALSVSLDTLDRAKYEQIRGADQLPQVLDGLSLLNRYSAPKFLICIVSELNRDEAGHVVRFAREKGFLPVVGAYHWDVGLYGKQEVSLMYERRQASAVFEQLLAHDELPPGYLRQYAKDTVSWLRGEQLAPCDAGRYSIAIDASGNVSPCLSLPHAGNLLQSSLGEILPRFDRRSIRDCSDRSSCNRVDGRVIGSVMRHPIKAWRTPISW